MKWINLTQQYRPVFILRQMVSERVKKVNPSWLLELIHINSCLINDGNGSHCYIEYMWTVGSLTWCNSSETDTPYNSLSGRLCPLLYPCLLADSTFLVVSNRDVGFFLLILKDKILLFTIYLVLNYSMWRGPILSAIFN